MKFTLEIELGNVAMQTAEDVGYALRKTGEKFIAGNDGFDIRDSGKIRDDNGNNVGHWDFTE